MTTASSVAQTSKSAVSQVSKPAGRGQFEARPTGRRPAGLETCATTAVARLPQTSQSAVSEVSKPAGRGLIEARPHGRRPAGLETGDTAGSETCATSTPPRTAPAPLFGRLAQSSRYRVSADVCADAALLFIAANPVVEGLPLPKRFLAKPQNLLRSPRSELLPRLQNLAQQKAGHRPDDRMNVIGHDHPVIKHIPLLVEEAQGTADQVGDVRPTQVTGTNALIEVTLDFSAQLFSGLRFGGRNLFAARLRRGKVAHGFGFFPFKAQQNPFGQRIRQSKRNKVRCPLAFHMRQIASRVDAGPHRVRCIRRNPIGSQRVASAFQPGVGFIGCWRLHGPEINPVPQTSKSAVSQVSKPAGRGLSETRPHGRRPAGLEAGDTAGLETCATTERA